MGRLLANLAVVVAVLILFAVVRRPAEPDVGDVSTRGGEPIRDLVTPAPPV